MATRNIGTHNLNRQSVQPSGSVVKSRQLVSSTTDLLGCLLTADTVWVDASQLAAGSAFRESVRH